MKYCSLDIETSGLNPNTCDIIEFGAVVDNLWGQPPLESLPTFHRYIYRPSYRGEPFALAMHGHIFKKICDRQGEVTTTENLVEEFYDFLVANGFQKKPGEVLFNVAGKNFAMFDKNFIDLLPKHPDKKIKYHHRILDPAMLYLNKTDAEVLPGSQECMKRAGLDGEVAHTALEDAFMVVKLLRAKFPMS